MLTDREARARAEIDDALQENSMHGSAAEVLVVTDTLCILLSLLDRLTAPLTTIARRQHPWRRAGDREENMTDSSPAHVSVPTAVRAATVGKVEGYDAQF